MHEELVRRIHYTWRVGKRDAAAFSIAALLAGFGFTLSKQDLKVLEPWSGWILGAQALCWLAALALSGYAAIHVWRLAAVRQAREMEGSPFCIKGATPFTENDSRLFVDLGRERDIRQLLGYVLDDQTLLIVLMGASGAGKTSLLRAGLAHAIEGKGVRYHYWEASSIESGKRLLHALQSTWKGDGALVASPGPSDLAELAEPNQAICREPHVIIIDQAEQLGHENEVFELLRKVIRKRQRPHRITWIIAFRREFRADWADFIIPEQEETRFYPVELSLRLFKPAQAKSIIVRLLAATELSIHQTVVDRLVEAATIDGEVSPFDIGTGLQALTTVGEGVEGRTLTVDDYDFLGGAEGLLAQYVSHCLEQIREWERPYVLHAMLALGDPVKEQRLADGLATKELAKVIDVPESTLKRLLARASQRDMRLVEPVGPEDSGYRLTHDRLLIAARRLAGHVLSEVENAKSRLETSFVSWRNSGKRRRYLLMGSELKLVERCLGEFQPSVLDDARRDFIRASRIMRKRTLAVLATASVAVAMGTLWGYGRFRDYENRMLLDPEYPMSLYEWQHRLQRLDLAWMDLGRCQWIESNSLATLSLAQGYGTSSSISCIDSLRDLNSLRSLNLDLRASTMDALTQLGTLTSLTSLNLSLIDGEALSLAPLETLEDLTTLILTLGAPIARESRTDSGPDFSPLGNMARLRTLRLYASNSRLKDLRWIEKLSELTTLELDLDQTAVSDLSPLESLVDLTSLTLNLSSTDDVHALEPLKRLRRLSSLDLCLPDGLSLEPLRKLTALSSLKLCSDQDDLGVLVELRELRNLEITVSSDDSLKEVVSVLVRLGKLTTLALNLRGTSVTDLSPLQALRRLTSLELDLSRVGIHDDASSTSAYELGPLQQLDHLERLSLDLSWTKTQDIRPLQVLRRLKTLILKLDGTDVRDLAPLESLSHLTDLTLRLGLSNVVDLSPLQQLGGIEKLELSLLASRVGDLKPLARLTRLSALTLDLSSDEMSGRGGIEDMSNLVTDLTPLEELAQLTHLDLNLKQNEIATLASLTKLTRLAELRLYVRSSNVVDMSPLQHLTAVHTLMLMDLTPAQRRSIILPPRVTDLRLGTVVPPGY